MSRAYQYLNSSGAQCACTDPDPFVASDQISLTNWVELIRIEQNCSTARNQFEMIPFSNKTLRSIMCKWNITGATHAAYIVTKILSDRFKIKPIPYDLCNETYITRKTIYFFVNNNIPQDDMDILERRLFDYYRSKSGTVRTGSVYFPEPLIRFPFQMPSRYVVFR